MKTTDADSTRHEVAGSVTLRLTLLLVALILFAASSRASLTGTVVNRLYEDGNPVSDVNRTIPWTPGSWLADSVVAEGRYGLVTSAYSMDLASARMGLRAHVEHAALPTWGVGIANATFVEGLTFTVPAGTYENALWATLTGSVEGVLSRNIANGYHVALLNWNVSFSNGSGTGNNYRLDAGETYKNFSDPFAITFLLAMAGTTFGAPTPIHTYVSCAGYVEADSNWGAWWEPQPGLATADMGNTVQFFSMQVPVGVTWTSESGVFMTAVPEPSTWIPGALVLIPLGILRFRGSAKRPR